MRIAYLSQTYPPMVSGASIGAQLLAMEMPKRGHDVLVLTASDRNDPYTTLAPGLRLVRLKSFPNALRASQRSVFWPQAAIRQELRQFKPDLIHTQDSLHIGLIGLLEGSALAIPTLLTINQLPWFVSRYVSSSERVQKVVEDQLWRYGRWFASRCAGTIALSDLVAEIYHARTGMEAVTIGWGIDLSRFRPEAEKPNETDQICARYDLDPACPVLLHVGRLDKDKQVHLVLEAAAEVFQAVKAQLMIVGDGAKRKQLERYSAQLGLDGQVRFTGFVDRERELPAIYRLSSVFLTASEIETQGLVVVEALASGLPVVAPRAGALPDLVTNGRNGFLVPPKAVRSLAERTTWLLRHPAEAKALGAAGVGTARRHSVTACLDAHEAYYQKVFEAARSAPAVQEPPGRPRPVRPEGRGVGALTQAPLSARRRRRKWLINGGMICGALLLFWLGHEPFTGLLRLVLDRPAFSDYIKSFGLLGPAVLAVFQFAQVVLAMVPGHGVVMVAGYIYGLLPGFLFNLATIVLSGFFSFWLARRFGRPVVVRLAPAEVIDRWDQAAEEHGFAFFLTSYLLPVFPADAMNFVAGLSSLPFRQFFIATFIGRMPSVFLVTSIGTYGLELARLPIPGWAWVLLIVVSFTAYYAWQFAFRRYRHRRNSKLGQASAGGSHKRARREGSHVRTAH